MFRSFAGTCKGVYCNVCLEEGVIAASKTQGVTKKSILLDRYENPKTSQEDPLGLKNRKLLSLDYLTSKFPLQHPSTSYNLCKVCKNCELAYSIIDCHRSKNLSSFSVSGTKNPKPSLSHSSIQTRLSLNQSNFTKNISRLKKKIEDKKNAEYKSMKTILIPIGHTRMSKIAEELLISINPEIYNNEQEKKMVRFKSNSVVPVEPDPVCELAESILKKRVKKIVRFTKKLRRPPKNFNN